MFGELSFSIIVDSRASLSNFPDESDFVGSTQKVDLRLGEMSNGMIIEGKGKMERIFTTQSAITLTIITLCYYDSDSNARPFSPQRLFSKSNGATGRFIIEDDQTTLTVDG